MTLQDCLERGVDLLSAGPHADRARLDAETLLLHHIGKNKAWLMAHAKESYAGCSAIAYWAMLQRRHRGEPMQYVTGGCEFYGLPLRVTPDVLIPRPETEHLVEQCLGFADQAAPARILDVGTGSGAIAISLAVHLPRAVVTATDISASAIAVARDNAERNHVAGRIRFAQGDLLASVAGENFELIVSNPPYVPETERASLSIEVREYEPALALFAGSDGLEIYRRLVPAAFAALAPGGYIALEIGYGQQDAIRNLLAAADFEHIGFSADLQGIARVACAQKK